MRGWTTVSPRPLPTCLSRQDAVPGGTRAGRVSDALHGDGVGSDELALEQPPSGLALDLRLTGTRKSASGNRRSGGHCDGERSFKLFPRRSPTGVAARQSVGCDCMAMHWTGRSLRGR